MVTYTKVAMLQKRHLLFLSRQGEGHFPAETLHWFSAHKDSPSHIILLAYEGSKLVGMSLASYIKPRYATYSITVVHRDYRYDDIGSELLRRKLEHIVREDSTLYITASWRNIPSLRMITKALKQCLQATGRVYFTVTDIEGKCFLEAYRHFGHPDS